MAAAPKVDSLEERLMDHAKSFDSLLSLMPADVYFGKDNSDQWQRRKQTKEEKKAAKKAKLDPDNVKTAKDVFDEQAANAKKRKRNDDGEEDATNMEAALEGISKKQKKEAGDVGQVTGSEIKEADGESRSKTIADKARERRERKKAKADKKAAKAEAKKARKQQEIALKENSKAAALENDSKTPMVDDEEAENHKDGSEREFNEIDSIEMDNSFAEEDIATTASPSPTAEVSVFDASNQDSGSSSISSVVLPPRDEISPLPKTNTSNSGPKSQDPNATANLTSVQLDTDPEELKARLAARIEALRTARKASDPLRTPQSRQELIESRRRKEEERKAHKKELRRKAREEEAAKRSETLARGSPLLSNTNSPLLSPGSPAASSENNNFSFGRISFANGQHANASLDAILTPSSKQKKGPSDPRTALQAAENRRSRLAGLDPSRQADIAEKDVWLNAQKRAHGDRRIRDDTSLLKKTLKRKDKQKKKSEKEWSERIEGVKKGQAMKQKKREANLQKRRDEKGVKGAKKGSKGGGGGGKKKARPGFEGSFKAKAPSGGGGGGVGGEKPRRR